MFASLIELTTYITWLSTVIFHFLLLPAQDHHKDYCVNRAINDGNT